MNGLMNTQEQTQGFAERLSIATRLRQWFSAAPSGAVTAKGNSGDLSTMADKANPSSLTDNECQERQQYFIQGYLLWAVAALFANSLVWMWRPWF